jgi:WhiB family redox-sensing transcriptional regulator
VTKVTKSKMAWEDRAACNGMGPDDFFPESALEVTDVARKTCGMCPVRNDCLEWAIANNEKDGIWGGLSAGDRSRLVRRRKEAA